MTTIKKQLELKDKILIGLDKAYKKLLDFKKQKNSKLVVLRENKIIEINSNEIVD